jgi:hypothetical protein
MDRAPTLQASLKWKSKHGRKNALLPDRPPHMPDTTIFAYDQHTSEYEHLEHLLPCCRNTWTVRSLGDCLRCRKTEHIHSGFDVPSPAGSALGHMDFGRAALGILLPTPSLSLVLRRERQHVFRWSVISRKLAQATARLHTYRNADILVAVRSARNPRNSRITVNSEVSIFVVGKLARNNRRSFRFASG